MLQNHQFCFIRLPLACKNDKLHGIETGGSVTSTIVRIVTGLALTLGAAMALSAGPANANEFPDPRYAPPSPDFVLVTQLAWNDKTEPIEDCTFGDNGLECVKTDRFRQIVMQQWESETQDIYILRTFSPENYLFADANDENYRRTYRGSKVVKPRPKFSWWQYKESGFANRPSTLGAVDPDSSAPLGFDLWFKRSDLKAGKYTALFSNRELIPSQWKCSIYYKDVCYWDKGEKTFYFTAYPFDVKNRTIVKVREVTGYANTAKQLNKKVGKIINRK